MVTEVSKSTGDDECRLRLPRVRQLLVEMEKVIRGMVGAEREHLESKCPHGGTLAFKLSSLTNLRV
ncbi:hypothetical protein BDM02DRAFT_3113040 [Thelephora ganbajun]|uniref:Uncharacterized protein n=1 Tax=Thelephora ganbajun TaxID=370292 RepID=A0ACB6ZJ25_THEGA|nr:hypothetical protein BDM02DRAFT_3113040 [Thelephora ganbajun]